MRTAGPVRRSDLVALDRQLEVLLTVEEVVDCRLPVSAGDESRTGAELDEPLRELATGSRLECPSASPPRAGSA